MEILKKLKIKLPYDPTIPLLGIYPNNTKTLIQKNICTPMFIVGFPGDSVVKSICQCRGYRFKTLVRKTPWRRKQQSTPVFLPGKSHGQRRLVGYSPWGHKRAGHDLLTKQQ